MTQMGIEYQKMKNQRDANIEAARANKANEDIKRLTLSEDVRLHDLQRQTSLDVAASQAATSRYVANTQAAASRYAAGLNAQTSRYHTDQQVAASKYAADTSASSAKYSSDLNLKKGTAKGAWDAAGGGWSGFGNVVGYLWDTLI